MLYDLAPPRTGKRGRPPKHGRKLCLINDFPLSDEKIGDYHVVRHQMITNLLKERVMIAFVTAAEKESGKWLFLSTIDASEIEIPCAKMEKSPFNQHVEEWKDFVPLLCYAFR